MGNHLTSVFLQDMEPARRAWTSICRFSGFLRNQCCCGGSGGFPWNPVLLLLLLLLLSTAGVGWCCYCFHPILPLHGGHHCTSEPGRFVNLPWALDPTRL
jgi:hypothetical protein